MNTKSTCNLCLKIVNSANPAKLIYALAVDLGGNGLDVNDTKMIFENILTH